MDLPLIHVIALFYWESWSTILNHRAWLARQLMRMAFVSCIFSWPGFEIDYCSIDLMHCGCLGVNLYLLGSVIWERFHVMKGFVTRPQSTLTEMLRFIKIAAKEIGQKRPPINDLVIGMLSNGSSQPRPRLKVKAAESRHLLSCVNWLLQNLWAPKSEYEELVMQCVKALSGFYDQIYLWDAGDMEGRSGCLKHGKRFLQLYAELVIMNKDGILYKWFPKFHLFQHLLESQIPFLGNPKDAWCYFDESNIGLASKLAESCHPSTIHYLVLTKARL